MGELTYGRVIGHGSFGVVHHGMWKGEEVAIKKLRLPPGTDASLLPLSEITVLKYVVYS